MCGTRLAVAGRREGAGPGAGRVGGENFLQQCHQEKMLHRDSFRGALRTQARKVQVIVRRTTAGPRRSAHPLSGLGLGPGQRRAARWRWCRARRDLSRYRGGPGRARAGVDTRNGRLSGAAAATRAAGWGSGPFAARRARRRTAAAAGRRSRSHAAAAASASAESPDRAPDDRASRLALNTSSHAVRSMPPVTRAISRSVFRPSSGSLRGSNSGEYGRLSGASGSTIAVAELHRAEIHARPAAAGTAPRACPRRPTTAAAAAAGSPAPLAGRHDRRRRRANVVGAAARASGIELDADDALAALPLDRRLHAGGGSPPSSQRPRPTVNAWKSAHAFSRREYCPSTSAVSAATRPSPRCQNASTGALYSSVVTTPIVAPGRR